MSEAEQADIASHQFADQVYQVPQRSTHAVKFPYHQYVPRPQLPQQLIKRWTCGLRAARHVLEDSDGGQVRFVHVDVGGLGLLGRQLEDVRAHGLLDELRRVSRFPKFKAVLQPHRVGAMVNNLQRALVLDRLTSDVEADDPFDAFLLAMAIASDEDYLVTGDHRAGLLQREHIDRTRIVTPEAFCAEAL